ncbi:hypothetical protein B5E87_00220 [Massilimicrobiota sp. An142]|uniref:hypothetical protein n=1 Tax=Massilimicrobiota sp. An142 TaxID=1965564 RepID=UPI000B3AA72D|nr:hypothetical protein [Massilimicrobiota sp. An142]OUQ15031.1 hypothetical protein B5E87_00220 [Massilimicrobiota sp. An142]
MNKKLNKIKYLVLITLIIVNILFLLTNVSKKVNASKNIIINSETIDIVYENENAILEWKKTGLLHSFYEANSQSYSCYISEFSPKWKISLMSNSNDKGYNLDFEKKNIEIFPTNEKLIKESVVKACKEVVISEKIKVPNFEY